MKTVIIRNRFGNEIEVPESIADSMIGKGEAVIVADTVKKSGRKASSESTEETVTE